ncbi:uncharacterized protein CCR75_008836 [Bremia lactucae]|uniref:Soluble calcium-activated nucleotidase 1 n=1 Tax=Bremia lactucae TaxID=4779 RepID=A0A976FGU8_BRELC|nr:hypothetical protein CCR75_008836 [Bremia lactucae]
MYLTCLNIKKKKRKVSFLDEDSFLMWTNSRGKPLPNGGVAVLSSRAQSPQAAIMSALRHHGRNIVLLVALAALLGVTMYHFSLSDRNKFQLRTPENWRNVQPLLLPSDSAKNNMRQQPTLVPPPKPDSLGIVIVADLDKNSKQESSKKPEFMSFIMHATLTVASSNSNAAQKHETYSVTFGEETKFLTSMNEAGRGFELSELAWFGGKLLAFDDRTGIVFRLMHYEGVSKMKPLQAIPEHIIMEGDGINGKGQKHEWATVKDGELYMGSVGKEFTDIDGNVLGDGNLWIAVMDLVGDVRHEDWTANYAAVRKALGCEWPGYVVHEAIEWSPFHRQWFILPRRVSTKPYNDMEDEKRGSNKIVIASEDFSRIQVREVGKITPLRGFSSFKFIPRSDDSVIVAIKSEEVEDQQLQTSFITVFDVDGNVLLEETEIPGAKKYEGVAFAHDWSFRDNA